MIRLRNYQLDLEAKVFNAWNQGAKNVLAICPTGGGKSLTTASIIQKFNEPTCLSVHRAELVVQLSESLAQVGIVHRIIASKSTIAAAIARHIKRFGRSYFNANAPVGVVSVQTLAKRAKELEQWLFSVKLWVQDETHHLLSGNTFGANLKLMPNARGLGVTATPIRCDGKDLGDQMSGVFQTLVEGPDMKWLIDEGFLANYKYFAPPPSFEMTEEDISSSTGELKNDAIRRKSHDSQVVGDIVKTYLEIAAGKQGITFVIDTDTASSVANAFNAAGVPAAAVSGKTPDNIRSSIMDQYGEGRLKQLVNVDLFDEGLDCPGVEVVSMGRPTMSLGKFRQQAGRMIRPVYAPGYDLETREGRLDAQANGPKPYGILIDHVNNWKVHRVPDAHRVWQINVPEKDKKSQGAEDAIPLTACTECFQTYEAITKTCPHCGHVKVPAERSAPEHVDGDITEFSPELMAMLRGEIQKIDGSARIPFGASEVVKASIKKNWRERQDAQHELRDAIRLWAGVGRDIHGRSDEELYRRFYHNYGMDVLTAMTLGRADAEKLLARINVHNARYKPAPVRLPGVTFDEAKHAIAA